MDIEELASKMRQRALEIEAHEVREADSIRLARQKQLDAFKKLYFNAGRWAGGARDRLAKEAFDRIANGN
jgi:hypothetical protein